MTQRRVTIMAGGTGGHIFPGLAVAEALRERGYEISWIGAYGLERELVPEAEIPLHSLPIQGLRGKGVKGWFQLPFKLYQAVMDAYRYLKKERPDCVIGFGGFASAPGGIAAKLLGIPLVIHEQNGVAGLANRLLHRLSNVTLTGFPEVFKGAEYVGNPVRAPFAALGDYASRQKNRQDDRLNLLILGGSQGARAINRLIAEAMPMVERGCRVWHQTGRALYEESVDGWRASGILPYRISPFITDMPAAYGWADLVICRAGALTIAELLAANVPALLIPFPYAVDDHQTKNGESLVANRAAKLYQEQALDAAQLANLLNQITPEELAEMAKNGHTLAKPHATDRIADVVENLIKGDL